MNMSKIIMVFAVSISVMLVFDSPKAIASLSGQKGDVRGWPSVSGGCKKLYNRYIKASGHSAFAASPRGRFADGVCGVGIYRGSKRAAESAAMKACTGGLKRFRMKRGVR